MYRWLKNLEVAISAMYHRFKSVLKLAISPTNRNSATITDITNKNQVSALSNFADTVNISQGKHLLNNLQKSHE